jgi:hypothetical protein
MKPLTLLLVLALSSWCPTPAAADTIDLTGGTIHWSASSDLGTTYGLTGPEFSVSGRAADLGFHNVSGLILTLDGRIYSGADVGYTLNFTHCEAFTACPTVSLDGIPYSPQTTQIDGLLEVFSTATTLSTPNHEFVPGFLGVPATLALSCVRWVRRADASRSAVDRSRNTRWP